MGLKIIHHEQTRIIFFNVIVAEKRGLGSSVPDKTVRLHFSSDLIIVKTEHGKRSLVLYYAV